LECFVGEKGVLAGELTIEGTSGHAAFPYRTDNPLLRLTTVLDRLAAFRPEPVLDDIWLEYLDGMGLPGLQQAGLSAVETFDQVLPHLSLGLARHFHAVTRTTLSPTVVQGGTKRNVIPDRVHLHLDVRVRQGETREQAEHAIWSLLDGLDRVNVEFTGWREGSSSPRHTALWDALERVCAVLAPGAVMVPGITAATTDGRHVRPLGSPCYGFGLFSERIDAAEYFRMFHSTDERIDQDSLVLLCRLWQELAREMLGADLPVPPAASANR
jgi:acetylornithine deacetylase/succinyl-diaminopimelate desuccinylase-like protein